MTKALLVKNYMGETIRRIDVSGKSESYINKAEMGLLRNMNIDKFYVQREEESK